MVRGRRLRRHLPVVGILALGLQPVDKDIASDLVGISVGVHGIGRLDGADHVVVEVEANLVSLLQGEMRPVVEGPYEASPFAGVSNEPCCSKVRISLTPRHPTRQTEPCWGSPCTS